MIKYNFLRLSLNLCKEETDRRIVLKELKEFHNTEHEHFTIQNTLAV
jgi:hypothetical protein